MKRKGIRERKKYKQQFFRSIRMEMIFLLLYIDVMTYVVCADCSNNARCVAKIINHREFKSKTVKLIACIVHSTTQNTHAHTRIEQFY